MAERICRSYKAFLIFLFGVIGAGTAHATTSPPQQYDPEIEIEGQLVAIKGATCESGAQECAAPASNLFCAPAFQRAQSRVDEVKKQFRDRLEVAPRAADQWSDQIESCFGQYTDEIFEIIRLIQSMAGGLDLYESIDFDKILQMICKQARSQVTANFDEFFAKIGTPVLTSLRGLYAIKTSDNAALNQALSEYYTIILNQQTQAPQTPEPPQTDQIEGLDIEMVENVQPGQEKNTQYAPIGAMGYDRYKDIIEEAAAKYNLDKALIASIIAVESAGNPNAKSPDGGALGLMQLRAGARQDVEEKYGIRINSNPFDPRLNIMAGCAYLAYLRDNFSWCKPLEVLAACYNQGMEGGKGYAGVPSNKLSAATLAKAKAEGTTYVSLVMGRYANYKRQV